MTKKLNLSILAAFSFSLAVAHSNAFALDPGWYGNLSIGSSKYSEDELNEVCDVAGVKCSVDNEGMSFRAGAGYKFNPYFGLEAGYLALGDVTYSSSSVEAVTFEADGGYAALVGEIPLGASAFSIVGTAGGAYLDAELGVALPGLGKVSATSDKGTIPYLGIGGAYNSRAGNFSLRLMWEQFDIDESYSVGGTKIDAPEIDMVSLALIFRFGK